ncbi:hypothetical protein DU508_23155 [Pedobacter chinensis]|uniref:Uncharacterized protein n=1 Tax=Pedobacter chinensis TaxID=2282421 RepID=A0A369PNL4_9SPHI|nr:hypothetical protein [Pedobacter chinensis]RDC54134.1 hypothetical protein DU508_23155 [Pedobacter chinensis]
MNVNASPTKTSLYFSGYTKAIGAVVVSISLILLSTEETFLELIIVPKFYTSLCFGFLIAMLLIEFIHWINVLLDHIYSWQQWQRRIPLQLILGVLPLICLDWLLVKGMYFMAHDNFEESGFTEKILPLNTVLICMAHLLFYLRHRYLANKAAQAAYSFTTTNPAGNKTDAQLENLTPQSNNNDSVTSGANEVETGVLQTFPAKAPKPVATFIHHGYWAVMEGSIQNKKYTYPVTEIVCIATASVYGDIYLKDGRNINMKFRKKILRKCLDPDIFVEIKGGIFFAYDVIAGIQSHGKENVVILKEGNRSDLPVSISRRFFPTFEEGFSAYQRRKN